MGEDLKSGTLYVVATPIGNLEDIGARALKVLAAVDVIAAEDTRHTATLLRHYAINTPMLSLHEHNESRRAAELVARVRQGASVALVSDAGTPLVSDPGYRLVREAVRAGLQVSPVPGACALVAALSVGLGFGAVIAGSVPWLLGAAFLCLAGAFPVHFWLPRLLPESPPLREGVETQMVRHFQQQRHLRIAVTR